MTQMSLWMNNLNKHIQSCYEVPVSIFVITLEVIDLHWYFCSKLIILIHFQHNVIEQFKEILKTFKILKMINISSFKQHQCLFFFLLKTIKYKYTKLPTTTQTHHTFNGNARYLFFPINFLFAPRFISLVMFWVHRPVFPFSLGGDMKNWAESGCQIVSITYTLNFQRIHSTEALQGKFPCHVIPSLNNHWAKNKMYLGCTPHRTHKNTNCHGCWIMDWIPLCCAPAPI